MGQGVVFGKDGRETHYIAREQLASQAARSGAVDGEISQRDLASHLSDLAAKPAERLDGEAWGVANEQGADLVDTVELRSQLGKTVFHEIKVKNQCNTFAPYKCEFTSDSHSAFSVTPNAGSMNR